MKTAEEEVRCLLKNSILVIDQKHDRDGKKDKSQKGTGENSGLRRGRFKRRDGCLSEEEKSACHQKQSGKGGVAECAELSCGVVCKFVEIGVIMIQDENGAPNGKPKSQNDGCDEIGG